MLTQCSAADFRLAACHRVRVDDEPERVDAYRGAADVCLHSVEACQTDKGAGSQWHCSDTVQSGSLFSPGEGRVWISLAWASENVSLCLPKLQHAEIMVGVIAQPVVTLQELRTQLDSASISDKISHEPQELIGRKKIDMYVAIDIMMSKWESSYRSTKVWMLLLAPQAYDGAELPCRAVQIRASAPAGTSRLRTISTGGRLLIGDCRSMSTVSR